MSSDLKFYKDKEKARNHRNRCRKRNYAKGRIYNENDHKIWSQQELDILLVPKNTLTDRDISILLNRSVQSIQIKRCRLKKKLMEE